MKKGFTLVEMLVVIAILGILMAMMVPAAGLIVGRAKKMRAKSDAGVVGTVMTKYHAEYNRWPGFYREEVSAGNGHFTDMRWVTVMSPPPAAPGEIPSPDNMKRISMFEPSGGALGGATRADGSANPHVGAFVDPWGNPFEYDIDTDLDGLVSHPSGMGEVRARVIAWSAGPDGQYEFVEGHDNVTSWEEED